MNMTNYAFDMAASITSTLPFEDIPLAEKIAAMRQRLDAIEAEANSEAFGMYDAYDVEDDEDGILYHESCGMIRATIQWHDGGILEDVIIKQTHDVGDDDEDIFFYGLTWDEVKRHLRDGTPVDNEFSIVSACLEC